jgi:predicted glycosyltransferase
LKIFLDLNHPAHVHLFKNLIWELKNKNHEILVTARDKDLTLKLLDAYKIGYVKIGNYAGINGLFKEWSYKYYEMFKLFKEIKPDVAIGMLTPCLAHPAWLMRKKTIFFHDSEVVKFVPLITYPFSTIVLSPNNFKKSLGKRHIFLNTFKELAYLHPNYFKPDIKFLETLNLEKNERFVILRFIAWGATHDIGKHGLDLKAKIRLVSKLEKYAKVFITSENPLPPKLEKYKIRFPPEKIHDALYFAAMFIGDSQTMTTEAGVLGTPAIRCNSFVGENDMGNFIELEKKYRLIFNYSDPNKAINKAVELIQKPNLKEKWKKKRETLLKDKIDVTASMIWLIENYPESFRELKENPKIQYRFK